MESPNGESVARYRDRYRAEEIPRRYWGAGHLAFVILFSLGGIAIAISQLANVSAWAWLTVPVTFLYANLVEYLGHRFAMHRKLPGLGLIYRRHAGQHHRFFTDQHMELDSAHDFRAVLFPPLLVIFFFGLFAFPVGMVIAMSGSANVAWLFVATALAYYLNYELLHLTYHLPRESRLARLPGLARLKRLHQRHHNPKLMARFNFNITYPIFDRLFRTRI